MIVLLKAFDLGLLHVRGGVSNARPIFTSAGRSSPRTWRCFRGNILPYCVIGGLLHVRGGVSGEYLMCIKPLESSPRTWRCFYGYRQRVRPGSVFSTYVEVFLRLHQLHQLYLSLLHVRGGVSNARTLLRPSAWSSPRTWRCFLMICVFTATSNVFSTYVEVFPTGGTIKGSILRLLHVRGGVSRGFLVGSLYLRSSPRTWRCFHGFAPVIIVSASLLHVRGGVS